MSINADHTPAFPASDIEILPRSQSTIEIAIAVLASRSVRRLAPNRRDGSAGVVEN